ncbi:hypothetical protein CEXT_409321 [Caerostris extrusa]|uniref:Uncharacterized protein n=1 Tax=Caerostris extrusa TaxID=172846 RepID=A0AAV4RS23_CAEEX|nr:hypothetical protein CEXT_409321 [Caerostris extrusa]
MNFASVNAGLMNPSSMNFASVNAGLMNPSSMNESFKWCWLPDRTEELKYNTKVHVLRCRIRLFHFRPEKSVLSFPDNPQYAGTLRIEKFSQIKILKIVYFHEYAYS